MLMLLVAAWRVLLVLRRVLWVPLALLELLLRQLLLVPDSGASKARVRLLRALSFHPEPLLLGYWHLGVDGSQLDLLAVVA